MKKRILCFFMVISLVLPCCFGLNAVGATGDLSLDILHKCNILNALGIMNTRELEGDIAVIKERKIEDYGIFRNISKSSFINYICNIYGDNSFTDEYDEKAIELAESAGIIHKGQTDLNKPLYYDEALTMVVRMLGYGIHAEESGGFPLGYIGIANQIGLTDGLSAVSGERMQEFDAVTLLYNAIGCGYAEMISVTDSGVVYGSTSETPFLYEFRKIYRVDGVVEATGGVELVSGNGLSNTEVMIDGYVYDTDADLSEYVGMNVEAYVKETGSGRDRLLFAQPCNNSEIIIKAEDVEGTTDNYKNIRYSDERGNKKTASVTDIAKVLYNGQPIVQKTDESFSPGEGYIRLINNDGKSGYDVVFITDLKTVVVKSVSHLNESVTNKYTNDEDNLVLNLEEKDDDYVDIREGENKIKLSDLIEGDVITFEKSEVSGKKYIKGQLAREKMSGEISAIYNRERTVLVINNVEYELSEVYKSALEAKDVNAAEIKVGQSYTFSLDAYGKIAFAKKAEDTVKYGIAIAATTEGVFNKISYLKIFTSDGEFKIFTLAEKIELDGERGVLSENVIDSIKTSQNGEINVIAYKADTNGQISYIDVADAYDEGNNGEFNELKNQRYPYRHRNASFESEIFVGDTATVWAIDKTKLDDEESYMVSTKSIFTGDTYYDFHAYNIDRYGFAEQFVLLRDETAVEESVDSADLFVVESCGEGYDAAGNIVSVITGMSGNYDRVSYLCDDPGLISGLNKGDVVSLCIGNARKITGLKVYRRLSDGEVYANPSTMHTRATVLQGKIDSISAADKRMIIDCGTGKRKVRIPNDAKIIIYDTGTGAVIRGDINDIEEGNLITTKLQWSNASAFVVFQ